MGLKCRLYAVVLPVLLAGGCAFSDDIVIIDFAPSTSLAVRDVKATLTVEPFGDERGVEPFLLAYKGTAYRTAGRYLSVGEVANVVAAATRSQLKALGYTVQDQGGAFLLSGKLLKYDSTPLMGLWSGAIESSIQLSLELKDRETGSVLWHDILSGTWKKTGVQVDKAEYRKEVMEKALADMMHKLAESESFKEALETQPLRTPEAPG